MPVNLNETVDFVSSGKGFKVSQERIKIINFMKPNLAYTAEEISKGTEIKNDESHKKRLWVMAMRSKLLIRKSNKAGETVYALTEKATAKKQ